MIRMRSLVALLLAGSLAALTALQPAAVQAQELAVAAAPGPAADEITPAPGTAFTVLGWPVSSWLIARASSSVIGIVVFNLVMTSLTAAPPAGVATLPAATVIANRVVAASVAGTAAIGTMFAYDKWTGQPLEYGYAWSRGGFVAGATVASATLTVLGYQAGDWFSTAWTVHRSILLGAGVLSGWVAQNWYQSWYQSR
jgi:hypothetical protein